MSAWKKIKQSQKKNDKLKRKWSQRINLSSSYTSKRQIIQLKTKMSQGYGHKKEQKWIKNIKMIGNMLIRVNIK